MMHLEILCINLVADKTEQARNMVDTLMAEGLSQLLDNHYHMLVNAVITMTTAVSNRIRIITSMGVRRD